MIFTFNRSLMNKYNYIMEYVNDIYILYIYIYNLCIHIRIMTFHTRIRTYIYMYFRIKVNTGSSL